MKIYKPGNDNLSLEELFEDLEQIFNIKKCSFCGCNASTLQEFETVALQYGKPDLAEKAKIMREVVTKNKKYECNNCNPCYPADVANSLFKLEDEENGEINFLNTSSCSSDYVMEKSNNWPIEKGEYLVGNEKSAVAVCTLASMELSKLIYSEIRKKIAIVGCCETENIGVEKVVKNIITNPNIRYLILCGNEGGKEMMGHFAGQAILSLHANGISNIGKIIGAIGKRPILKNIDSQQIQRFQLQIEVINLIDTNSVQEIGKTINLCLSNNNYNYDENSVNLDSKKLIVAKIQKRLVLDKKGFFVILPQQKENKVYVEYYANSGRLLHTIVGTDAPRIYNTIIEKGFISKLDHAAYLGKELIKAEYNLKYDIPYIQDKA